VSKGGRKGGRTEAGSEMCIPQQGCDPACMRLCVRVCVCVCMWMHSYPKSLNFYFEHGDDGEDRERKGRQGGEQELTHRVMT